MVAPSVLSFSSNAKTTIAFFDQLKAAIFTDENYRRKGAVRRKELCLELDSITSISLPCAVILSAELKRWTTIRGLVPRLRNYKNWDQKVRSLLINLGTLKHLGIPRRMYDTDDDIALAGQFILLELTSATTTDTEKIAELQHGIQSLLASFQPKPYIYTALVEAAANVIDHAYNSNQPLRYGQPGEKRWYATASFDPGKNALRFFVYDQGVGIPASLRRKTDWYNAITPLLQKAGIVENDVETIDAAFALGRTRTQKSERGKGLADILSVLKHTKAGHVRVLSGKGDHITYADQTVEKHLHGSHVGGTLIEWSLPIHAVSETSGHGND